MPKTKYPIFKSLHRGQKGFTLIELLIVVAILGIIAAVVIPNVGGFMIAGRLSAANSEAMNVRTASLAYYAERSEWPVTSDSLMGDYIAGEINATYNLCPEFGWLVSVSEHGWGDTITFAVGTNGTGGNHGEWVRAS